MRRGTVQTEPEDCRFYKRARMGSLYPLRKIKRIEGANILYTLLPHWITKAIHLNTTTPARLFDLHTIRS